MQHLEIRNNTGSGFTCNCGLLVLQDHYDWGLRAMKSVLAVAGSLKREDKSCPEEQVLMGTLSALRSQ